VNVVVTIVFFAGVALWGFAVYNRLLRLRDRVKEAWRLLQADQTSEGAKTVYNRAVESYNAALNGFPANVIAALAGFTAAREFKVQS
jgi:hypothetical protein